MTTSNLTPDQLFVSNREESTKRCWYESKQARDIAWHPDSPDVPVAMKQQLLCIKPIPPGSPRHKHALMVWHICLPRYCPKSNLVAFCQVCSNSTAKSSDLLRGVLAQTRSHRLIQLRKNLPSSPTHLFHTEPGHCLLLEALEREAVGSGLKSLFPGTTWFEWQMRNISAIMPFSNPVTRGSGERRGKGPAQVCPRLMEEMRRRKGWEREQARLTFLGGCWPWGLSGLLVAAGVDTGKVPGDTGSFVKGQATSSGEGPSCALSADQPQLIPLGHKIVPVSKQCEQLLPLPPTCQGV